jgi:endonuclease/exonuclease/phosphatase family metal-dependent hydrolase
MKIISLILLSCLLSGQAIPAQTPAGGGKLVRVLTFNILHGATTKGDFNLDVIARVISEANPDFVALQEVDFKTNRARQYDLATELGWRTKMIPLFARAMYFDGGEYGNGILSACSFISTKTVALPCTPGNEPRVAVEVIAVLPSKDTVAFIGTHLDHQRDENERIKQSEKLNAVFSSNKYPTILAGDLNAIPGSTPIKILQEVWTSSHHDEMPEPTFPSVNPSRKIDYVMFMPRNRWKVIETRVIQDPVASDHCAYLVTLELLEK